MKDLSELERIAIALRQFERNKEIDHELSKRMFMRKYNLKSFRTSSPRTRLEYEADSQ